MKITAILLAGGIGSRMGSETPKQFLAIKERPMACYSFDVLSSMAGIVEVVVVCDPAYREFFRAPATTRLIFALPGNRRQDSVFNGLQAVSEECELICIHDAARPFITRKMVRRVLQAGAKYGAAALAMPVKQTIKLADSSHFVTETPNRDRLWEIQTPQVARTALLKEGFAVALRDKKTVTDDVSLIELLNHPVKLVEGSYTNLKITTPEDLEIAHVLSK